MDLFSNLADATLNLLPKDGVVNYYGQIFTQEEADHYYQQLLHKIEWRNDEALMFGKLITTKRKVAWYAETDFEYTYSKITKRGGRSEPCETARSEPQRSRSSRAAILG